MQNERQPRSTAHVSLDSINMDSKKEHLATTRELTSSAAYLSAVCRPLVTSSVSTSASKQACSNPNNSHRFMVSLLTAETCAKLEPEDGKIIRVQRVHESNKESNVGQVIKKQVLSLNLIDSLFLMCSGGEYRCDNQRFRERSDSL